MIELLTHLNNIESSMKRFRKELIQRKKRFQKLCINLNLDTGIILTEELIEIYLLILENFSVLIDPFNTLINVNDLKHMMSILNKDTKSYLLLIMPLKKYKDDHINQSLLQDGLKILLELQDILDQKYTTHLNKVEPNNLQNYYFNDIKENKYHNLIYVEEKIIN